MHRIKRVDVPVTEVGQTSEARTKDWLERISRFVGEGEIELEVVFDLLQRCQR